MTHTALPECTSCKILGQGFPCRTNGRLDLERLVTTLLDFHRAFGANRRDDDEVNRLDWAYDCVSEITRRNPDLGVDLVILGTRLVSDAEDAGDLAAGALEDLIYYHGDAVIDRIEALAAASARFRFVLSGVCPLGDENTEVWERALRAAEPGPRIDADDPLPPLKTP